MSTYVGGARLPAISEEFIAAVDAAWPVPIIEPGVDRDKLMFDAGARAVVEWIKHHASIKKAPDPVAAQQAVVRYGS